MQHDSQEKHDTSPEIPPQSPATPRAQRSSFVSHSSASIWRPIVDVIKESFLFFRPKHNRPPRTTLPLPSTLLVLGIHVATLFLFFLNIHRILLQSGQFFALPFSFVILLPLLLLAIHVLVQWGFIALFASPNSLTMEGIGSETLSIVASNTVLKSIATMVSTLLLLFLPLSSSIVLFIFFFFFAASLFSTIFLSYLRLEELVPTPLSRASLLLFMFSVQISLEFVALLSQTLRIVRQLVIDLFIAS